MPKMAGIRFKYDTGGSAVGGVFSDGQKDIQDVAILGRLTLVLQDARDIVFNISAAGAPTVSAVNLGNSISKGYTISDTKAFNGTAASQKSISLKDLNTGIMSSSIADALGYFAAGALKSDQRSGVTTYYGAQAMVSVAESTQKALDRIRSDLGSVQNQLQSTISNITVTQVNVKSSESQIRDVDFATEASNFNKYNLLAQSGSYAMSQANTIQQNVMRLLQN